MTRTVAEKIGARKGARVIFSGAPAAIVELIDSPHFDRRSRLTGKFHYIHLFVKTPAQFQQKFQQLKKYLDNPGMLWVSWQKSRTDATGLNIKRIIKMGYDHGLVESKTISINEEWSAIKFTWPRENIVYNNSYGKLKNK